MIEVCELSADDWPVWRELRLAALAEAPYAFGPRLADWQGDGDRAGRHVPEPDPCLPGPDPRGRRHRRPFA